MNEDLVKYYSKRAGEYELIYRFPERQQDLEKLRSFLKTEFKDYNVLEIACGTGYWTEIIASTAKSVLAVDINSEVIEIARSKNYPFNNVEFLISDIYSLTGSEKKFNALFGGFIWSHISLEKLTGFTDTLHDKIKKNSKVIFIDNLYIEGSSTPIFKADEEGNTYQLRKLSDGTEHLVLKNFPSKEEITEQLTGKAVNFELIHLDYYWILKYFKADDY
jgi:SAM-dependent methyltransferase